MPCRRTAAGLLPEPAARPGLPLACSCASSRVAELFSIIKATEKLERAYVRDAISPQQYEQACERLIAQFKVLRASLTDAVSKQCMLLVQL